MILHTILGKTSYGLTKTKTKVYFSNRLAFLVIELKLKLKGWQIFQDMKVGVILNDAEQYSIYAENPVFDARYSCFPTNN